ncbi:ABC transporter permease, partial [Pseudomonas sp. CrR25]|nr:ABC transporter permease [Pseudomonas sp. CrR25]
MTAGATLAEAREGPLRSLSSLLYRRPTLYLSLLLIPPLLWFGVV